LGSLRFCRCDADLASWSYAGYPMRLATPYRRLRVRERLSFPKCDLRHI